MFIAYTFIKPTRPCPLNDCKDHAMRSRYLATAAALVLVSATAAHATAIQGSFGFATLDLIAYDSSNNPTLNLADATSFSLGDSSVTLNATGNFAAAGGDTLTASILNLNDLLAFTFTGAVGTFQADALTYTPSVAALVTNGEQSTETVYEYGTFTPTAGSGLDPDSLSLTLSFTETASGSGTSLSVSGTAAAPAVPATLPTTAGSSHKGPRP
jgi:hypothetical protein